MKNKKIGRLTLAVTFILLGIVIFLEKILHYRLIDLLSMLWPSIIIIFGLEIIYRIKTLKNKNEIEIKLDWISISIVVLFVITIGIITTMARYQPNMKKHLGVQYKYKENFAEEVILNRRKKLIIDESNIDIVIKRSEYKNIKIILESIYKHNDIDEENFNERLKIIDVENNGGISTISRDIKNKQRFKKMNIENKRYLIYLPKEIDLEVRNKNGDIYLRLPKEKSGKFNIITTYGRIYGGIGFNVIESASKSRINEFRKFMKPELNVRVNNGDVIIETN